MLLCEQWFPQGYKGRVSIQSQSTLLLCAYSHSSQYTCFVYLWEINEFSAHKLLKIWKEIKKKNVLIWLHWGLGRNMWTHSLTRDWTRVPRVGSAASQPLDHQGTPGICCFLVGSGTLSQAGGGAVGDVAVMSVPHAVTPAVVPNWSQEGPCLDVHKVPTVGGGKFGCSACVWGRLVDVGPGPLTCPRVVGSHTVAEVLGHSSILCWYEGQRLSRKPLSRTLKCPAWRLHRLHVYLKIKMNWTRRTEGQLKLEREHLDDQSASPHACSRL